MFWIKALLPNNQKCQLQFQLKHLSCQHQVPQVQLHQMWELQMVWLRLFRHLPVHLLHHHFLQPRLNPALCHTTRFLTLMLILKMHLQNQEMLTAPLSPKMIWRACLKVSWLVSSCFWCFWIFGYLLWGEAIVNLRWNPGQVLCCTTWCLPCWSTPPIVGNWPWDCGEPAQMRMQFLWPMCKRCLKAPMLTVLVYFGSSSAPVRTSRRLRQLWSFPGKWRLKALVWSSSWRLLAWGQLVFQRHVAAFQFLFFQTLQFLFGKFQGICYSLPFLDFEEEDYSNHQFAEPYPGSPTSRDSWRSSLLVYCLARTCS